MIHQFNPDPEPEDEPWDLPEPEPVTPKPLWVRHG